MLEVQVDHVQEAFAVSSAIKLKPYLEWEDLVTVIHALIITWLDCYNSFYFGAVAHSLSGINNDEHIAPIL